MDTMHLMKNQPNNIFSAPPAQAGGASDTRTERVFMVPEQYDGARLYRFLREYCGMSGALIRSTKYLEDGFVISGEQAHTNRIVHTGEQLRVRFKADCTDIPAQDIPLRVLYESENAVVFDKPAGIVVHPTLGYPDGTVANAFAFWCGNNGNSLAFRPVYRIDKDTSGCLLVAKNRYAAGKLNGQVEKEYICFAQGQLQEKQGSLTGPIGLEDGSFIKNCVRQGGKPCQTDYAVEREFVEYSMLKVWPKTGRTHQIRVHFSNMGHPLLGDDFYGGSRRLIGRCALHCATITFEDDGLRSVTSPLPEDMISLLKIHEG